MAFGYEAIARAYFILKDMEQFAHYRALAMKAADDIPTEEDKKYFLTDLRSIDGSI